jgi:hypothetical protein
MSDNARFHNKLHRKNHHSVCTPGYPDSATDPIASYTEPFQGDFVINGSLSASGSIYTTFYTLSNISILTPVLSATVGFNPTNSLIIQLSGVNYAIPVTYVGDDPAPVVVTNSLSGVTTFSNGVSVLGSLSGIDSINWNNVYTIVSANSALWSSGYSAYTSVNSNSASWQSTYTTVNTNSAAWSTNQAYAFNSSLTSINPTYGNNNASGYYSNIAGGSNNTASALYSSVVNGHNNNVSGAYSFVAGGSANSTSGYYSNIAGGCGNTVIGYYSNIAGGDSNIVSGYYSNIAGGVNNIASGYYSNIAGGGGNTVSSCYSSILGGAGNNITAPDTTYSGNVIGGGYSNNITGCFSGILGGQNNLLSGTNSFILGSNITLSAANYTAVNNLISQGDICGSSFYGDGSNIVNVLHSTDIVYVYNSDNTIIPISGSNNAATGANSSILGGCNNTNYGDCSSIIGGVGNTNSQYGAFILGSNITAPVPNTTYVQNLSTPGIICSSSVFSNCYVFGDGSSFASLPYNFITSSCGSGAANNSIAANCGNNSINSGCYSVIAAGACNTIGTTNVSVVSSTSSGFYSAILGGLSGYVAGYAASIVGGVGNTASGNYSFIAGGSANDTKGFANTFILGTALSASVSNFTYVNNISSQGISIANGSWANSVYTGVSGDGVIIDYLQGAPGLGRISVGNGTGADSLAFYSNGPGLSTPTTTMYLSSNGYVGINTSAPTTQLTVGGSISATSIVAASALYVASISATAAAIGTAIARMPIYDGTGTYVGYIPIYTG